MFILEYARRHLRVLDDKIARAKDLLSSGSATTLAEYREQVGYIRGLREMRAALVESLGRDADGLPPPP